MKLVNTPHTTRTSRICLLCFLSLLEIVVYEISYIKVILLLYSCKYNYSECSSKFSFITVVILTSELVKLGRVHRSQLFLRYKLMLFDGEGCDHMQGWLVPRPLLI